MDKKSLIKIAADEVKKLLSGENPTEKEAKIARAILNCCLDLVGAIEQIMLSLPEQPLE